MQVFASGAFHLGNLVSPGNDATDPGDVFEVAIGPGSVAGRFRVEVIRSPAGEAIVETSLDADGLLARRSELQRAVLDSAVRWRRVVTAGEQSLQEVGQALFTALLGTPPVAARYAASALAAGKLRIILRINSPKLATLPWEAMYDPDARHYVCDRHLLVRHVPAPVAPAPLTVSLPLRVLGVSSAPQDQLELNAQREREDLESALAGLIRQGLAEVTWTPSASWDGLHQMLMNGPWHVIHFIGHGSFDPDDDEGVLVLEGEDGRSHVVSARQFANLLQQAQPMPRLIVLNACSTAAASADDLFAGTASALARSGMPAVAAMQYAVSDKAAIEFARGFYSALARGRGVDEATYAGRLAIVGTGTRTLEWVTPVLYLRSREDLQGHGAHLFTLTPASNPRNTGTLPSPPDPRTENRRRPADPGRLIPYGIAAAGVAIAVVSLAIAFSLRKSPSTASPPGHKTSTASATLFMTITEPGSGGISSVALSPNNQVLAASDAANGTVHEWTPGTSTPACTEPDPDRAGVDAVAFNSTSNVLAVADNRGHVYLWACDELVDTLTDPFHARVTSVAFSSDGAFLAAGDSVGHAYSWLLDDYPMKQDVIYKLEQDRMAPGSSSVTSVTFNEMTINDPQNTVLAAGTANGNVEVLQRENRPLAGNHPPGGSIQAMTFTSDDQFLVAADSRGEVYEWQCISANGNTTIATTPTVWLTDQHGMGIDAIAAYPEDDIIAVADTNGYISVGANDTVIQTVKDPAGSGFRSVAFSASGEYLAAGDADGHIYLWKVSV